MTKNLSQNLQQGLPRPRNSDATNGSGIGSKSSAGIDFSVVIPVYNEEANVAAALEEAVATLSRLPLRSELVVLDDASTDGSGPIIDQWQRRHPEVIRVLRHERNQGIAVTFREAYAAAQGDYVFLNSSDGQWKTAECIRMLDLRDRYDLVIGVRRHKHYTLWRKVVSRLFNLAPQLLFGVKTYDAGSIKLFKAEILQIPLISRGVFSEAERIIRAQRRGFRIGAIEVDHFQRASGRATGARFSLIARAVADVVLCWWRIVICRDW
jgi:glycosyltransferase involved in cell wall biosynthesis